MSTYGKVVKMKWANIHKALRLGPLNQCSKLSVPVGNVTFGTTKSSVGLVWFLEPFHSLFPWCCSFLILLLPPKLQPQSWPCCTSPGFIHLYILWHSTFLEMNSRCPFVVSIIHCAIHPLSIILAWWLRGWALRLHGPKLGSLPHTSCVTLGRWPNSSEPLPQRRIIIMLTVSLKIEWVRYVNH